MGTRLAVARDFFLALRADRGKHGSRKESGHDALCLPALQGVRFCPRGEGGRKGLLPALPGAVPRAGHSTVVSCPRTCSAGAGDGTGSTGPDGADVLADSYDSAVRSATGLLPSGTS